MKIINNEFRVGQRYIGRINKRVFRVIEVKEPGRYLTKTGGVYWTKYRTVVFLDEKTKKSYETVFETAQCLLLDKLDDAVTQRKEVEYERQ